jgi:TRAP-type C4-dicarboxylate transport system permease small subunit
MFKFKKIFLAIFIAVLFFNFFLASSAFAQNALDILEEAGTTAVGEAEARKMEGPGWLGGTAGAVINVFLGLLGTIFLILIIYGGFLWMTAAGNEEKIKKATQVIGRAVIGIIIVAMAYGITYFVLQAVTNATLGP